MKPLTQALKDKIAMYIRNKQDLADIIDGVDLRGANLAYGIITRFERTGDDMSGCNFSHCVFGGGTNILKFMNCKMQHCNFQGATFESSAWVRGCDMRGCTFRDANWYKVDYQHSDFRGGIFCNSVMRVGGMGGAGCKFDSSVFSDLARDFDYDVQIIEKPKEV
jgi:uncharacterized protein YjbI with pentapeptide repeats